LSSELQSRIIDDFGERQKEALLDYQKLDESVLDKLMSDKEFLKEHRAHYLKLKIYLLHN
jgi:hypothetical protein